MPGLRILTAHRAATYDSEDCSMRSAADVLQVHSDLHRDRDAVEMAANRGKLGGRRGASRTTRWQKGIFDDTGQAPSWAASATASSICRFPVNFSDSRASFPLGFQLEDLPGN